MGRFAVGGRPALLRPVIDQMPVGCFRAALYIRIGDRDAARDSIVVDPGLLA